MFDLSMLQSSVFQECCYKMFSAILRTVCTKLIVVFVALKMKQYFRNVCSVASNSLVVTNLDCFYFLYELRLS